MDTPSKDELPLLELFTRLREAGLPLGINEYQLVLRSLQGGFGVGDRSALAKLCRTLWIKSPEEECLFNHHFEQIIGHPTLLFSSPSKDLPKKELQTTQNLLLSLLFDRRLLVCGAIGIFLLIPSSSYFRNQPQQEDHTSPVTVDVSPIPVVAVLPSSTPSITPIEKTGQSSVMESRTVLLITIFGILIIGALTIVMAMLMTKKRKQHSISEIRASAKAVMITNSNKLSTELIQQIGDEVRVAKVLRQRLGSDGERRDRILTNPEFFPITQRQMKQSWRYLRRFIREGSPTEVDIDSTIYRIGRQGLLIEPVLVPSRVNRAELLMLIDQDGSMVPFHSLSQRLIDTALQGGRLGKAGVYYFHNCPTDYVYHDPVHQEAVAIDDFLAQLNPRTAVLIFSDAGSARGGFNPRQRRATKTFVDDLKQRVRYIAWLNPMPRSRWAGTTAGDIANLIPMFETSRQGLDGAIDVLRGKASKRSAKIELDSRT